MGGPWRLQGEAPAEDGESRTSRRARVRQGRAADSGPDCDLTESPALWHSDRYFPWSRHDRKTLRNGVVRSRADTPDRRAWRRLGGGRFRVLVLHASRGEFPHRKSSLSPLRVPSHSRRHLQRHTVPQGQDLGDDSTATPAGPSPAVSTSGFLQRLARFCVVDGRAFAPFRIDYWAPLDMWRAGARRPPRWNGFRRILTLQAPLSHPFGTARPRP
jgi:hypothetical protein